MHLFLHESYQLYALFMACATGAISTNITNSIYGGMSNDGDHQMPQMGRVSKKSDPICTEIKKRNAWVGWRYDKICANTDILHMAQILSNLRLIARSAFLISVHIGSNLLGTLSSVAFSGRHR